MKNKRIISLNITTGPRAAFLDQITTLGSARKSSYVCVANVHMVMEAYGDQAFAAAVNNADIITPDGMPLVKSMQLLYGIHQDRIAGMDLLPDLLAVAEQKSLSVFFYGAGNEVLNAIIGRINREHPGLNIAGAFSPPFRPRTMAEENEDIAMINESGANIVFVALGCPKQELWMARMKGKINAVMLGVGGAFPVYAGLQQRAPVWMQKYSLEWLFRLFQEPRRLFRRYLVTNTAFVVLLGWEMMQKLVKPELKTS